MGVAFGSPPDDEPFHVDPVPRIMAAAEWDLVERSLSQRVRALRAFTADVYGARRIVSEGVVPSRAVETCSYFEPWMLGVEVPEWAYMPVAGMDLVRGADGKLAVLEDNVRTPSGITYAVAARTAADRHLPAAPEERRSLAPAFDRLGAALRAAAPDGDGDPHVVLLSDGPGNSAWYEHRVAGPAPGHPAGHSRRPLPEPRAPAGAGGPSQPRGGRGLPPHRRGQTDGRARAPHVGGRRASRPLPHRAPRLRERLRRRRGRRQADPRLRGRDGAVLSRRAAAHALRAHLRPERSGRPRGHPRAHGRGGGEAAGRARRVRDPGGTARPQGGSRQGRERRSGPSPATGSPRRR